MIFAHCRFKMTVLISFNLVCDSEFLWFDWRCYRRSDAVARMLGYQFWFNEKTYEDWNTANAQFLLCAYLKSAFYSHVVYSVSELCGLVFSWNEIVQSLIRVVIFLLIQLLMGEQSVHSILNKRIFQESLLASHCLLFIRKWI